MGLGEQPRPVNAGTSGCVPPRSSRSAACGIGLISFQFLVLSQRLTGSRVYPFPPPIPASASP